MRASKVVPYGRVAEIMGAVTAAGYKKVALVTEPDSSGEARLGVSDQPSKAGLYVSAALHAALLAFLVFGFASRPNSRTRRESIPVDTVTQIQFNEIMKGERDAKPMKEPPAEPPTRQAAADRAAGRPDAARAAAGTQDRRRRRRRRRPARAAAAAQACAAAARAAAQADRRGAAPAPPVQAEGDAAAEAKPDRSPRSSRRTSPTSRPSRRSRVTIRNAIAKLIGQTQDARPIRRRPARPCRRGCPTSTPRACRPRFRPRSTHG